ncbi:hypothetical protein IJI69_00285 [Candidatus Saccharibacteria bacterium]|nr:hypothetical protein [Candidatus Saccharibacteria bacterium]MBQ6127127.1 hypothetical protein [Candidatus Saccharibacteria bacterium]
MTTYRIEENRQYNSREIYFDGKPSEATRTALKDLKMRWNSAKRCWYGYAHENEIIAAILGSNSDSEPDEAGTVITDGYLGGGAIYGSKSGKYLYGAELSAAIRADIKAAGIKGVTISSKTYAGGQSITATVVIEKSDTVSDYRMEEGKFLTALDRYGLYIDGKWYRYSDVFGEKGEWTEKTYRLLEEASRTEINTFAHSVNINQYHIDDYEALTPEFRAKLHKINSIISAYRYDESNSQVDYFDTNFYYDIETKAGKSWGG